MIVNVIRTYTYKGLTWHDLETPTKEEVQTLVDAYSLKPIIGEELMSQTIKPRADLYENAIYLILHFPSFNNNLFDTQEIDFVIGKNFLITTRYNKIDPSHAFSKIFDTGSVFAPHIPDDHAGYIFYSMMKNLYRSLVDELDETTNNLTRAESKIFKGKEKNMVIELSYISRDLLDFKEATNLHKSVLESFQSAGKTFFGKDFEFYLSEISNEYYKVHTAIQDNKDYLEELRRTNDSLLSNKQNEIMKTFTVLAFIFLPLSFIAGVFGMNIVNMPVVSLPHSFSLILTFMAALGLSIFAVAKYKEWL